MTSSPVLRRFLLASLVASVGFLLSVLVVGHSPAPGESGPGVVRAVASGRILFGHKGDIWIAEGGTVSPLTTGGRYWGQPDWSPDGTRIALVGWDRNSTDVFTLGADGADLHQLTRSQARRIQDSDWVFFPRWSPDGQTIAFTSDKATYHQMVWTMRADGAGARQLTAARSSVDAIDAFSWSPDGTQLAVTRFLDGVSQIHLVDLARPNPSRPITNEPGGALDPAWSPDGQYIAYAARQGKRSTIQVVEPRTGWSATMVNTELARHPRWSPNGAALAYIALAGRDFELFVVDLSVDRDGSPTAGRSTQLTSQFGVDATSGLSWAP